MNNILSQKKSLPTFSLLILVGFLLQATVRVDSSGQVFLTDCGNGLVPRQSIGSSCHSVHDNTCIFYSFTDFAFSMKYKVNREASGVIAKISAKSSKTKDLPLFEYDLGYRIQPNEIYRLVLTGKTPSFDKTYRSLTIQIKLYDQINKSDMLACGQFKAGLIRPYDTLVLGETTKT